MTPQETAKVLAVLAAAYPSFEVDDAKHAVWTQMLADLPYEAADAAARRHIMASRFAPTIADIRAAHAEIGRGDELAGAEAWAEFAEALRAGYVTQENLEGVSPRTAAVARMIGWRDAYLSENVSVLRGQFLRMYEQVTERDHREAVLPRTGGRIEDGRLRELAAGIGKDIEAKRWKGEHDNRA